MKKVVIKSLVLVLAIVTVFGLVGCKKREEVSGFITLPPEGEELDVSGTVTFSYSAAADTTVKNAADAYVDAFNKAYPNVHVEKDYSNSDVNNRIAGGDIGDVFYFAETQAYNYAITQHALMYLEYYMEALHIDRANVYQGIFDSGLVNGHLYYVARDFNQILFIYNKEAVVQKALSERVKPEWTWDEFRAICRELTDDKYFGADLQIQYAPIFIPFLTAYETGTKWYDIVNKKVDLTSGDRLKAIREVMQDCQAGYINLELGNDGFSGKESVFMWTVYPSIQSKARGYDQKEISWDLINLPLFPNPAFGAGSSGVGVYNRTANPSAAAALALFFYTEEGQRAFNGQVGGSVPLLRSMKGEDFWRHPDDEWSEKNWEACVYRAEDYAVVGQFECLVPSEIARIVSNNGVCAAIQSILAADLNGSKSLEDGFASLEQQINQRWSTLVS